MRFKPFLNHKKGIYYKLVDEYSLFYFHWIEPIQHSLIEKGMRRGYWEHLQHSPAWHTWSGYAFEALCYRHLAQIGQALGLSPTAVPYTWRHVPRQGDGERGAQVDLLFDRAGEPFMVTRA